MKPTPLHCLHAISPVPWQGLHCRILPNCLLPAACSSSNGTSRFPDPSHTKQRAPPTSTQLRVRCSAIFAFQTEDFVWTSGRHRIRAHALRELAALQRVHDREDNITILASMDTACPKYSLRSPSGMELCTSLVKGGQRTHESHAVLWHDGNCPRRPAVAPVSAKRQHK